jgi:5'-methylthioadenosine phosphorylase
MVEPGCPPVVGVIGGSGIYDIEGLKGQHWKAVETPFGKPSDDLLFGELDGVEMVFLPRHGRGHVIGPTDLNFRANIDALKRSGVTEIISLSAVGSLEEGLTPGTFVIIDQFVDRTFARVKSFFEPGLVAHVSMADPVCSRVGDFLVEAAVECAINVVRGGTYVVMEGPQFSTRAESELYRSWNCQVIGMTNMPEAKLAREAEICYATVAMVTDYDCWHPHQEDVTVDEVVRVLLENADHARALVRAAVPRLANRSSSCGVGCHTSLDAAVITAVDKRDQRVASRLDAVAGRVLKT